MANRETPAPSEYAIDALGVRHARCTGETRIVSLVPSLTELLFTLGLGAKVVGRTGFCVHPQPEIRRVPKVGGTKDVDLDRVPSLAPTHLIVNVDENRKEVVAALRSAVPHIIVTHPLKADDNVALFRLFGAIFAREEAAETLCRQFLQSKDALREAAQAWQAASALYLVWRNPWMTVSRATYISDMLRLAGWGTLPEQATARYPEAGEQDWQRADILLLATEPYRFRERDVAELRGCLGAERSVALIDGEMVSWYGSRAIAGLRYLREFRASLEAEKKAAADRRRP